MRAEVIYADSIVEVEDNYDRLYYEPDAIARSSRYSHYVDDHRILRTQTTAAIPNLLSSTYENRLLVVPGLVYRRDVVDRMHVGEPHQVDLWLVQKARLRRRDLLEMIEVIIKTVLPDHEYRCNETIHPYTVNGLEVEVKRGDDWVEVLECGEAHPWLLNDCDLPSQEWSGLAMGIGLDRLVMLIKGIDDIRLLRSPEPRIAAQMASLEAYVPVSRQPAIKRDMSICVTEVDMEISGDRIRSTLGEKADLIEEINLLGSHPYDTVPEVARKRLGMLPGQTNLLLRLVLRSPTESITNEEANEIYSTVYAEIHEGTAGYI